MIIEKFTFLLLILLIITSCASKPHEVDETLNPVELFQMAQEASENKYFEIAIEYYEVFIKKYYDNIQRIVEAEYEIALITYKQGNLVRAEELLNILLSKYSSKHAETLPVWPMILSRKLLKQINGELL